MLFIHQLHASLLEKKKVLLLKHYSIFEIYRHTKNVFVINV